MTKKPNMYEFYLSPEDKVVFDSAMQKANFKARGGYIMYLVGQINEIAAWRQEAAKEAAKQVKRFKLTREELDIALRQV